MGTDVGRVGRHGFTGSPITDWCGKCRDFVVRRDNGACVWCDHTPGGSKTTAMMQAGWREQQRVTQRENRKQADAERDATILGFIERGWSAGRIGPYVGLSKSGVLKRLTVIRQASS